MPRAPFSDSIRVWYTEYSVNEPDGRERTSMEPFVYVPAKTKEEPSLFMLESWMKRFPGLTAGFTSRHGGVSEPPYGTLNLGLHVQDNPAHVVANRQRLAEAIGVPFAAHTYAEQVHGTNVAVIGPGQQGAGRNDRESALPNTDGLVTAETGIALNLMYADCVPLYFFDPVRHAVGIAHAGWKGTVGNIVRSTVSLMEEAFGTKPEHLLAAIGPSIGVCCYEVDEKVVERVRNVLDEIDAGAVDRAQTLQAGRAPGKYQLSLQNMNRLLMRKAGILSSHIEVSTLCTGCGTDRFFSHRKEGGRTGRMVAWIALRAAGTARKET
jgi:YfiH family protein